MQNNITLSKKEKQHYFLYLLGMLVFSVILISLIALRKIGNPFTNSDFHSTMVLQEKVRYDRAQSSVQKKVDSTFIKLNKMDPEKSTVTEEYELEREIGDINSAFVITNTNDPRKKAYIQISRFFNTYFNDKKSTVNVKKNIQYLQKEYDDCSVGYKDKRQTMSQRENAIIMSQTRN